MAYVGVNISPYDIIVSMLARKNKTLKRVLNHLRRGRRIVFMSPAEAQFIRVMGGYCLSIGVVRDPRTKFSLVIVLSMGRVLRSQNVKREVRVAGYYIDFGNDIKRGIEIDGGAYHMDVVRDQRRDEVLASCGWLVLHIQAPAVSRYPDRVRRTAECWLENGTLPASPRQQVYPI